MVLILLLLSVAHLGAAEYFVAPDGNANNAGTHAAPWNLGAVCTGSHPAFLAAGDVIWVRGGTYALGTSHLSCRLNGTAEARIALRAYPGETPVIVGTGQGPVLTVGGQYADYVGLTVTWAGGFRIEYLGGSNPPLQVPSCIYVNVNAANNLRIINTVTHGCSDGPVVASSGDIASVYHGNIGWDHGSVGPDRLHGGWMYQQNNIANGRETVEQSMSVNQPWYYNCRIYTEGGHISGITWDSTICMGGNSFSYGLNGRDFVDNIFRNNFFVGNMTWQSSLYGGKAKNILLENEMYVGNVSAFGVDGGRAINVRTSGTFSSPGVEGDGWLEYGVTTGTSTVNWLKVHSNGHESGRGHVALYNWQDLTEQAIDLSPILRRGDRYEILDAWDALGLVASGVYQGGTVTVPLDGTRLYNPYGSNEARPKACWETSVALCDETGEYLVFEEGANCAALPTGTYPLYQVAKVRGSTFSCYWNGTAWVTGYTLQVVAGPNYTRNPRAFAFLVRRLYDVRPETIIAWTGEESDVIEAGYRRANNAYSWELPVIGKACVDGRCTARIPQAPGDAAWRINGGVAMKAAARRVGEIVAQVPPPAPSGSPWSSDFSTDFGGGS
jgi:hypothetical protein